MSPCQRGRSGNTGQGKNLNNYLRMHALVGSAVAFLQRRILIDKMVLEWQLSWKRRMSKILPDRNSYPLPQFWQFSTERSLHTYLFFFLIFFHYAHRVNFSFPTCSTYQISGQHLIFFTLFVKHVIYSYVLAFSSTYFCKYSVVHCNWCFKSWTLCWRKKNLQILWEKKVS